MTPATKLLNEFYNLLVFCHSMQYDVSMLLKALLPLLFTGVLQSPTVPAIPLATLNSLHIAPPNQMEAVLPPLSAMGIAIVDNTTGQELLQKNANVSMPMASITKLMTALIIAENHSIHEVVTIPNEVHDVTGMKVYLQPGDQYTVGDLLSATLIPSANDAAVTLALYHSGTMDAFVAEMNTRAKALGLVGTSYANPTGLDHPMQFSTPRDTAALDRFVSEMPVIARRLALRNQTITSKSGTVIALHHSHQSLHKNDGQISTAFVEAGKTGTTNNAKECLVSTVKTGNREYTIVLLHSEDRYGDLERVLRTVSVPSLALSSL